MLTSISPSTFMFADELLKRTTSRCTICHVPCPAEVWRTGGIPSKVFLKRTCSEHGETSVCIASDARFFWVARGKDENSCCGGARVPSSPDLNLLHGKENLGLDGVLPHQNTCCSADGTNARSEEHTSEPQS